MSSTACPSRMSASVTGRVATASGSSLPPALASQDRISQRPAAHRGEAAMSLRAGSDRHIPPSPADRVHRHATPSHARRRSEAGLISILTVGDNSEYSRVRLAEVVAALSLGIDLGFGQPMEHVLRQCLIALRLAERAGLAEQERTVVYYTALLVNVGCHSDAHEQAKWFGDDIALKNAK